MLAGRLLGWLLGNSESMGEDMIIPGNLNSNSNSNRYRMRRWRASNYCRSVTIHHHFLYQEDRLNRNEARIFLFKKSSLDF